MPERVKVLVFTFCTEPVPLITLLMVRSLLRSMIKVPLLVTASVPKLPVVVLLPSDKVPELM